MTPRRAPVRVAMTALALCAVSFFAGIAGDLAAAPPQRSGVSVVLAIPPDITRAAPLPPLVEQAEASPIAFTPPRRLEEMTAPLAGDVMEAWEKPAFSMISFNPKDDAEAAPKPGGAPLLVASLKA